ncbi:MAG: 30S ribosomal protein S4 [Candidatus Nanoarchaeia archaeon]|nr:30S ribosomal protein S4 [Candidatus Nanoarchaeia archaeon]
MGNIKKLKKSYERPKKPWEKDRILQEKELIKKYGYGTKKEIWRFNALLRGFRQQSRAIFASTSAQSKKEGENLLKKVYNMGLLDEKATFDDILGLTIDDISKRRLVNFVVSKGLARTPTQARQFIVHKHILVNGNKVDSPNYIVLRKEENNIEFADNSVLKDPKHPLIVSMASISKDTKLEEEEKIVKKLKEDSKADFKTANKKPVVEEKK